ncbi:MAG: histidinol-phosphate transaminase [Proteobacteria bacterium]|nr:histidinol-phosphate transaminase [Pseudomonadota bacterium]
MTLDLDKLVRPEIAALEPYRSARGEAPDPSGFLLLDANENPYPDRLQGKGDALNRYPEPQPRRLKARLARFYGLAEEGLLITRGSDEGIDLLLRAFCRPGEDAVITCPPTFGIYAVAAQIQGAALVEVPLDQDCQLDIAAITAAAEKTSTKLIFICSPNNPTGNDMEHTGILRLAADLPQTLIIVDEAYIEFSGSPSLAARIAGQPNLVVLRTLSKAFGLAGVRCGSVLAGPEIIAILRRVLAPYPVPTPVADAACEAVGPAGLARMAYEVEQLSAARDQMIGALGGVADVQKIFPSSANFLLVRFADSDAVCQRLKARGILVRDLSAKLPGCLRLSLGTAQENELLLQALGIDSAPAVCSRRAKRTRTTNETSIFAAVDLDRPAAAVVDTGIAFFDHMLEQLGKHGGFALTLKAEGDLQVDPHHTIEDCAILLGETLREALGSKAGIARYGFTVAMDEARAQAIIDLSGRAYCRFEGQFDGPSVGGMPTELVPHVFRSLADSLGAAIHIRLDGDNDHHKVEASFKALGRALRMAIRRDGGEIPSTKGQL